MSAAMNSFVHHYLTILLSTTTKRSTLLSRCGSSSEEVCSNPKLPSKGISEEYMLTVVVAVIAAPAARSAGLSDVDAFCK
jgi:hypothetical protein